MSTIPREIPKKLRGEFVSLMLCVAKDISAGKAVPFPVIPEHFRETIDPQIRSYFANVYNRETRKMLDCLSSADLSKIRECAFQNYSANKIWAEKRKEAEPKVIKVVPLDGSTRIFPQGNGDSSG